MHPDLTRRPRTKRAFSDADMAKMRDLYYDRDVPMTRVAAAFDVPVSTFLRWIAEMDWPRRSSSGPGSGRVVYDYAGGASDPFAGPHRTPRPGPPPAVAGDVSQQRHRGGRGQTEGAAPFDVEKAADDLRRVAHRELRAIGDLTGPDAADMPLAERRARADLIASLSRSIARVERTVEARVERMALRQVVAGMKTKLRQRAKAAPENPAFAEAERLLLATITGKLRRIAAADATPAPSSRTTPDAPPNDGKLTLPEYRQWWIDQGVEPP